MEYPRFNPSQSVKFDLAKGVVSIDGSDSRLLLPPDLLAELWASAGEEQKRDFGRRLGTELGRRVRDRLGGNRAEQATLEAIVEHLGGDLALSGFGSLSVERWGRALVLAVDHCPLGASGDGLVGAVLEGAIQRLLGRDTGVVLVTREHDRARFLVLNPGSALRVRAWLKSGVPWGEAIARLHVGGRGDA